MTTTDLWDGMDYSRPSIPEALLPLDFRPHMTFDITTEDLWKEVIEEVCDPAYAKRSHHNVGTYDQGCRGPLCKKALREHPKRRTPHGFPVNAPRQERLYDPILEFYHTVAKYRVREFRRDLLERLTG